MYQEKKYYAIVKVGNRNGVIIGKKGDGNAQCVKYIVSDLIAFTQFLDHKYPTWRYINVYDYYTRIQVANFTKNKRPTQRKINH
jgi:hypothetical protein